MADLDAGTLEILAAEDRTIRQAVAEMVEDTGGKSFRARVLEFLDARSAWHLGRISTLALVVSTVLLSGCSLERIGLAAAGWEKVSEPTQSRAARLEAGPDPVGPLATGDYKLIDLGPVICVERALRTYPDVNWIPIGCVAAGAR